MLVSLVIYPLISLLHISSGTISPALKFSLIFMFLFPIWHIGTCKIGGKLTSLYSATGSTSTKPFEYTFVILAIMEVSILPIMAFKYSSIISFSPFFSSEQFFLFCFQTFRFALFQHCFS